MLKTTICESISSVQCWLFSLKFHYLPFSNLCIIAYLRSLFSHILRINLMAMLQLCEFCNCIFVYFNRCIIMLAFTSDSACFTHFFFLPSHLLVIVYTYWKCVEDIEICFPILCICLIDICCFVNDLPATCICFTDNDCTFSNLFIIFFIWE